jgi:hypothetical protein
MTSGKRGREDKSLGSKRTKNRRATKEARLESTRGAWMSRKKQKRRSETERGAGATIIEQHTPKDTMNEWLEKQPIPQKVERMEVKPLPLDTTEEWLRRQVSEKLSKNQEG